MNVLKSDSIDTSDETYKAWKNDQSISLKDYLNYAASQNWIDISQISTSGEYLDSTEIYQALTDYVISYLKTDTGFSKLLYKYMLQEDTINGQELCLVLYEQGVLSKEDELYQSLASGQIDSYTFMYRKIANLEITPAQLALAPCSASAVLTDVETGDVLACVSYPGYDNNRLTNNMDTDYYAKLSTDLSSPFFNKATQQRTAPGSTLKILSTVAGMSEGVIDDNTYIECTGSFDLVTPPINCWNKQGHSSLEIRGAIEQSCNVFFSTIGFELGKDSEGNFSEARSLGMLQKYASLMGLDRKTGIEISEASPQVSDKNAVPSYIGQGTNLFTTSQLARYATTIATSGSIYKLSLLNRVTDSKGNLVKEYPSEKEGQLDIASNIWDDIHDGMYRVVQTHDQFNGLGVEAAGKTGTAEIDYYHRTMRFLSDMHQPLNRNMQFLSVLPMDMHPVMPALQQMIFLNTFSDLQMKAPFSLAMPQAIPVMFRMTKRTRRKDQKYGTFYQEESENMSEVIVITSGKGGVGKTTTVANIGTGLAAMGKKVVVVDTDIGLRTWMLSWDLKIVLFTIW